MKTFTEPLEGLHEFALIRKDLESGQTPVRVSGCIDVQKSHLISALGEAYPRKLIITYSETKARQILADYRFFDSRAVYYPAKDLIFYSADVQSDFIVGQRMTCINRILSGEPVTVVTVIDSLMDKIQKPEQMRRQQLHFTVDDAGSRILITAEVKTKGRTGVEMEALTAVSAAALTIYDMCKAVDRGMHITDIRVTEKDGGKSGHFTQL